MPYISPKQRELIDPYINNLIQGITKAMVANIDIDGIANYVITKLLLRLFPQRRYATMARALGCIAAVGLEFYRRHVAPYENTKIAESGDVYPPEDNI